MKFIPPIGILNFGNERLSDLIIRPYAKISKNWVLLEQGRSMVSVIMQYGNGKNTMIVNSKIRNSHTDSHTKEKRLTHFSVNL